MPPLIIAVIALALIFDFLNGVYDSSNVLATMILVGSLILLGITSNWQNRRLKQALTTPGH